MISLLSLLLLSANVASAETPVFVADLQPTNDDSVGMAALVTTYLTDRLAQEARDRAEGANSAADGGTVKRSRSGPRPSTPSPELWRATARPTRSTS